jgi:hypothetical protein
VVPDRFDHGVLPSLERLADSDAWRCNGSATGLSQCRVGEGMGTSVAPSLGHEGGSDANRRDDEPERRHNRDGRDM